MKKRIMIVGFLGFGVPLMKDDENLEKFFLRLEGLTDLQCIVISFLDKDFIARTPEPMVTQPWVNAELKKSLLKALSRINMDSLDTCFFIQERIQFVIVNGLHEEFIHPLMEYCSSNITEAVPYTLTLASGEIIHSIQDLKYGISSALSYAEYARFLQCDLNLIDHIVVKELQKDLLRQYPCFDLENYERALLNAIFRGDIVQAEIITNYFLISHLMRDIDIFATLREKVYNFLRFALALNVKNPGEIEHKDNRYNKIWNRIFECVTLKDMQTAINDFYILISNLITPLQDFNVELRKLQSIMDYIKTNFTDPLFCENLICEKFDISISYLSHVFKKHVGMSFSAYIQTMRIEKAKQLILSTNDSMNTIAKKIGYSSGESMLKLFKRMVGLSPSQFKKNYCVITDAQL